MMLSLSLSLSLSRCIAAVQGLQLGILVCDRHSGILRIACDGTRGCLDHSHTDDPLRLLGHLVPAICAAHVGRHHQGPLAKGRSSFLQLVGRQYHRGHVGLRLGSCVGHVDRVLLTLLLGLSLSLSLSLHHLDRSPAPRQDLQSFILALLLLLF